MKLFFLTCALMLTFSLKSQSAKKAPSSNANSTGGATSGVGNEAFGPNSQEKKQVQSQARRRGGVPNMGAGIATGSGP